MKTGTSLEELQFLLEKETASRKAAEAKLEQKELEWKIISEQTGYQLVVTKKIKSRIPNILFPLSLFCEGSLVLV